MKSLTKYLGKQKAKSKKQKAIVADAEREYISA